MPVGHGKVCGGDMCGACSISELDMSHQECELAFVLLCRSFMRPGVAGVAQGAAHVVDRVAHGAAEGVVRAAVAPLHLVPALPVLHSKELALGVIMGARGVMAPSELHACVPSSHSTRVAVCIHAAAEPVPLCHMPPLRAQNLKDLHTRHPLMQHGRLWCSSGC